MRSTIDNVNHKGEARPDDVLELIHAVTHRARAQRLRLLRGAGHELTQMDARVLGFFGRHPGATPSDLALHSGRDKAQLARLIKGLRERGLLAGEADAADRRQLRLTLTSAGQALHRALQQQGRRLAAKAVAGLDPADHQQLQALLQRLLANLADEG